MLSNDCILVSCIIKRSVKAGSGGDIFVSAMLRYLFEVRCLDFSV